MKVQTSFTEHESGTLYIVPTPIGNLEDITYRALKILETAAVIAAEDTRNTKKLMNHFDIKTPLVSYHEHNKESRGKQLLERLEYGDSIAVVSDAGMPAISDPGQELIKASVDKDFSVVVLPGANAALCALVGSGLPAREFYFYGFLPRKKKEKTAALKRLAGLQATLIFYESPYRLHETLKVLRETLGNRQVALARELTKKYETYVRDTIDMLQEWASENVLKGECCLVVEGASTAVHTENDLWWSDLSIVEHVTHYIHERNLTSKDAIKFVAKERNMPKRDVYKKYHVDED